MAILVFNSGSSSLKFRLYAEGSDGSLFDRTSGAVTRIGPQAGWNWRADGREAQGQADLRNHGDAARWVLARLRADGTAAAIGGVGHRVVHGGNVFKEPVLLTPETLSRLEALTVLAPLHNPLALQVITACRESLDDALPMVAVFDTAFHASLPDSARAYALPGEWVGRHGIRRYGFHGLAHRYMYERYVALDGRQPANPRVISFQLGNGCSACAVRDGKSAETSMGYTPLEGLVMSTRSGDIDPGALVRLVADGVSAAELEERLNRGSGLLALSGETGDMRSLLALEAQGHAGARLAVETFCHRARKYLGAYLAVLGGADAVLFGGGIGEHSPAIRARICAGMEWCGLRLDRDANAAATGKEGRISAAEASPRVYVVAVDEEILIARDTRAALDSASR